MKRTLLILTLGALLAPALMAVEVRTLEEDFAIEPHQRLRLDVPVAEVVIDGTNGDRVALTARLDCARFGSSRCRERAERFRIDARSSHRLLTLEIEGYEGKSSNGWPEVDLVVSVPRGVALELEMGVGELEIRGLENDLELDIGVGEVKIHVPERAVGSVDLEVGVGDADLRPRPRRTTREGFLFLGNEVRWNDGPGRAHLEVAVGVGEVDVYLD